MSSTAPEPLYTATALTKAYGDSYQLGPATFAIGAGELIGLLGKNGSGKTTLFQLMTGNTDATSGEIRLGGQKLTPDTPELKRRIGYLPQDAYLPRWATGRELLAYAASLYGLADAKTRVPAAEEQWDCASYNNKPLSTLSYGMQKRVGLALATLADPACLILDEPFSGLDLVHIRALETELTRRRAAGRATVLSTHVTTFCARQCDRVLIIERGALKPLAGWEGQTPERREAAIEAAFFGGGASHA